MLGKPSWVSAVGSVHHDGGFAPAVLQAGACKDSLELEM